MTLKLPASSPAMSLPATTARLSTSVSSSTRRTPAMISVIIELA